ncbi:MAG: VOC family protein [Deltaproteobacteria bacterium]|nr:VOC family protein [Deltaproteobacteria bacterium]
MPNHLQHLHLFCRELQPMADFWVEVLDATFEQYRKFGDADGAVLDMRSVTKIFLKQMDCVPADTTPRAGVDHPGVLVDDLDATLEKARNRADSRVSTEPFMSGSLRCAFITGPEGVLVEVMQQTA